MNYKLIANYIGNILRIEGLFMIPALLVSLYHNEFKCVLAFGISIAALLVIGQLMHMIAVLACDIAFRCTAVLYKP